MNVFEAMERDSVRKIERHLAGFISITLDNGNIGVGKSYAEALEKAKADSWADTLRELAA